MSYTRKIKDEILKSKPKKSCCKLAFLGGIAFEAPETPANGILYTTKDEKLHSAVLKIAAELKLAQKNAAEKTPTAKLYTLFLAPEKIKTAAGAVLAGENKCPACASFFAAGIFIEKGAILAPSAKFHLELTFDSPDNAREASLFFSNHGFETKTITRRKKSVLYMKNSESIEDFLYFLNASKSSYEFMEEKVIKDLRNNLNRRSNFEGANMNKSSSAAARQIAAVNKLIDGGKFDLLPEDLKYTANLRLENIDMTLAEIAEISVPKLTKSGINHRIKKIIELSEKL